MESYFLRSSNLFILPLEENLHVPYITSFLKCSLRQYIRLGQICTSIWHSICSKLSIYSSSSIKQFITYSIPFAINTISISRNILKNNIEWKDVIHWLSGHIHLFSTLSPVSLLSPSSRMPRFFHGGFSEMESAPIYMETCLTLPNSYHK